MEFRRTAVAIAVALASFTPTVQAAPVIQSFASGVTPDAAARALVGDEVTIVAGSVVYQGAAEAGGGFSNGMASGLTIERGLILSSGRASDAELPNNAEDTTTDFGLPGLDALTALSGNPSLDAAVLSFSYIPTGNVASFRYVFASEEYQEFVNAGVNDVFAFYFNGVNYATVPGSTTPVSIDTINAGSNAEFFRANEPQIIDITYDGLTTVLEVRAPVNPGVVNQLLVAISDAGDAILDSTVFIEAGTLTSEVDPGTQLGGTAQNPFLPTGVDEGGGFTFGIDGVLQPTTEIFFIDPLVAVGYEYSRVSGPNFASVIAPALPFDFAYDLFLLDNGIFVDSGVDLQAGVEHIFATGGVESFQIRGIDVANALSPTDGMAFVTGLSLTSRGPIFGLTQRPLTQFVPDPVGVPAPGMFALLGIAGLALRLRRGR